MTLQEILPKYTQTLQENQRLQSDILQLKQELAEMKRLIFGQKRERFIPSVSLDQLSLLADMETVITPEPAIETISYNRSKASQASNGHGRNELPAHLPRIDHVIEPDEDTSGLVKIGEVITEELEYTPPSLVVNRYIRPKYARSDNGGVIIGDLPNRPIEKGIPGPGLLAQILISKYADHLPLYRQRKIFKRHGMDIPSSTIDNWVKSGVEIITPLHQLLRERIRLKAYLQADETPIRVLDRGKCGKTHQGYFWVYHDPLEGEIYFEYKKSRSREGPRNLLEEYQGYLQTDGYAGYDELGKRMDIQPVHCMAHARRYFEKALENDRSAGWMMEKIGQLYAIEAEARRLALSHEDRKALRQDRSTEILAEMKTWLDRKFEEVLPKSGLGKAIGYMLSRWKSLTVFCEDGRLEIDNNLIENAIRPVAIGRKNYLFAGSHKGADRAAIVYTLIANAKHAGVEPYAWLCDIISRIADHPYSKLDQLLPQNYTSNTK